LLRALLIGGDLKADDQSYVDGAGWFGIAPTVVVWKWRT
jgi:hypothetical protein